ncbi:MAG: hypothetical protein EBU46_00225 [Nitrosomonadaceae bacterium]|nr:hypothetical protein [Nitrosomonadaceae bacterium]
MTVLHTRVRAKHPFSIGVKEDHSGCKVCGGGQVVIAAKEEGRLATAEECQQLFNKTLPLNNDSPFVAVVFRQLKPCIILRRQIEIL